MTKKRSLYKRMVLTISLLCTATIALILTLFAVLVNSIRASTDNAALLHNVFLGTSIALLVGLYILVYFHIKRLFRPMQEIKKAVETVADGNFDLQIPVKTSDEFGELAESFNKMANEIQSMLKYKDQLLSDVSHELRTPITRMRLAAEMMEEGKEKDSMISDLKDMSHLVETLLESNRLNYGLSSLNKESFDLTDLLSSLVAEQSDTIPGIQFQPRGAVVISADLSLIKMLFRNLINNGLKYSAHQEEPIVIELIERSGEVMISIVDKGMGIPEKDLPQIFEPFYRVEQSRSKNTGGYGLGLSIAHKVVEAHQGKISLKNAESGGIIANVELPLA
ncbi:MAG: HAMP domain-containing histidine kinase [Roseivirga sp.]|nr:HAMP domain-containing histidine kinase [Roseivirga sp.]